MIMKKFMLIIFYEIFFVSFMFVIPIAYFVYTIQLIKFVEYSLWQTEDQFYWHKNLKFL